MASGAGPASFGTLARHRSRDGAGPYDSTTRSQRIGGGWPGKIPEGYRRSPLGLFMAPDLPGIPFLVVGTLSIRTWRKAAVKQFEVLAPDLGRIPLE